MALTKTVAEIVAQDTSGLLSAHPSWRRVHLREFAQVLNGFPFDSAGFNTERGTPLARIRDVLAGRTSTFFEGPFDDAYLIADGDLLVGMDGDFNCARWRGGPALLNQRVCKVTVDSSQYEPRLLDALLPVYLAAINAETSSVTVKHLSSRTIEDIWLPLPPRAEQARLADTLDELLGSLNSAVADLRAAKRKLTLYRQSLLKSAVEGTLTAGWRGSKPRSAWSSATIGDLAEVGTGVTPLRSNSRYFDGGTIPWVTSGALNAALVTAASEFVSEVAVAECRLKLYPPGTLLVAMYGEGKTRGKCSELAVAATINQAIAAIVLRPAFEKCRAFLKAFLWHSYESMRQQASGGVQPNLNLQIVKNISVPLPPLDEQQEIVLRLDTMLDATKVQEEALDRALAMAAAQRQNILRAAFSGQLVPQNPADEPASVLLERIRAQRPARAAEATGRRPRSAKERA